MDDNAEALAKQTENAAKTTRAAVETRKAAHHTAAAAAATKSSAERTTELAADRTVLALERTYAAWTRTGLFALASGIGARKLLEGVAPGRLASATAIMLLLFSAFSFLAGTWRQLLRVEGATTDTPKLPGALLVIVNAFLVLVVAVTIVGVVAGPNG
jgi:putative membrane protein